MVCSHDSLLSRDDYSYMHGAGESGAAVAFVAGLSEARDAGLAVLAG